MCLHYHKRRRNIVVSWARFWHGNIISPSEDLGAEEETAQENQGLPVHSLLFQEVSENKNPVYIFQQSGSSERGRTRNPVKFCKQVWEGTSQPRPCSQHHPSIISLFWDLVPSKWVYLFTEYVPGGNTFNLSTKYCHDVDILHGDLQCQWHFKLQTEIRGY